MSTFIRGTLRIGTGVAAAFAVSMAMVAPAQAGGFYGPRSTIPVDPLPQVEQTCGAVFEPSWAGPRPPRFVKVKDLGPCEIGKVERWLGPRATIPVHGQ